VWQAQATKHKGLQNEGKMSTSNKKEKFFTQNILNSPLKENI
jgi:hypothetical protein